MKCPCHHRPTDKPKGCVTEKYFSNFTAKTYVVGIQKNCLNEMVLLSTTVNNCKLRIRKISQFSSSNYFP